MLLGERYDGLGALSTRVLALEGLDRGVHLGILLVELAAADGVVGHRAVELQGLARYSCQSDGTAAAGRLRTTDIEGYGLAEGNRTVDLPVLQGDGVSLSRAGILHHGDNHLITNALEFSFDTQHTVVGCLNASAQGADEKNE